MPIDMSNKSLAVDNRVAVADDGLGIGALGAGSKATDSATSISTGLGSVNKFGSSELIGNNIDTNRNNSGTITYGLGAPEITKLLSDTTGSISNLVKQQSDTARSSVADVVTGLQDLALSKQTDGESNRDKTILWIIGFLVVGALAYAFSGGKRG